MRQEEKAQKVKEEHKWMIKKKQLEFFKNWETKFDRKTIIISDKDCKALYQKWTTLHVINGMAGLIGSLF